MELSEKKRKALEDLQSQNWHKMYLKNFGAGLDYIIERGQKRVFSDVSVSLWITYTMKWTSTPQGGIYWKEIHSMWWNRHKGL